MNRLMIIDDQKDFAAYLTEVAEQLGFAVAAAHSVLQAQPMFEKFQPDMVMLDMVMPEDDGLKFLEWMRDQALRPRLIVMSGFHQIYTALACKFCDAYGLGPVQVLTKPIAIGDLRKALRATDQAA